MKLVTDRKKLLNALGLLKFSFKKIKMLEENVNLSIFPDHAKIQTSNKKTITTIELYKKSGEMDPTEDNNNKEFSFSSLYTFVKTAKTELIEITLLKETVELSADGFVISVPAYNGAESVNPLKPAVDPLKILIAKKEFAGALQVAPACSKNKYNADLMNIRMRQKSDQLEFSATDRKRMANFVIDTPFFNDFETYIPATITKHINKLIQKEAYSSWELYPGYVEVFFKSQKIIFGFKPVENIRMPEFSEFIPKNFEATTDIKVADLIQALKQILPYTGQTKAIDLAITSEGLSIQPTHNNIKAIIVPQERVTGTIKLAVNAEFLLDAVSVIDNIDNFAYINFSGKYSPIVISDRDIPFIANGYRQLLMPLNI